MRRIAGVLLALWCAVLAAPAAAQEADGGGAAEVEAPQTYQDFLDDYARRMGGLPTPPAGGPEAALPGGALRGSGPAYTASDEMRAALGRAVYEDHIASFDYNRRVFEWQMTSTRVSFWVVIGLVGIGVLFAGIQFRRAMTAKGDAQDLTTDLEISSKGIKMSSPVLGVIILGISLAFFYLYLRHVYPIEQVRLIGADRPGAAESAPAAESAAEGDAAR